MFHLRGGKVKNHINTQEELFEMLQDLKSYEFASSTSMISFNGICLHQNMVFLHSDSFQQE